MDDYQRAGKAGNVLIDLGPDKREINVVLVDFVRRLDVELQAASRPARQNARCRASRNRSPARPRVVDQRHDGQHGRQIGESQGTGRKSMIYLGTLYGDVDDYDDAEKQYKALLDRADSDPDFKKEAAPSFLWVRAQLVELLGKRGKLDEATAEIAKLRKEKPNNLDFMRVEAQLWQDWGQKDPNRYDTAMQKWTEIRRRLQHQRGKAMAGIYYDATYNASFCLYMEASKLALSPGKKEEALHKAEEAQKIIKSELIPNPKLDGPDNVKRFNDMLSDADKLKKKL